METCRILYVEDELREESSQSMLWTLLVEEGGFEVVPARSGQKAEDHLTNERFALVIFDIMMEAGDAPGGSHLRNTSFFEMGLWILERLREGKFEDRGTRRDVPVIVVTAVNNVDRWRRIQAAVGEAWEKSCFRKPVYAREVFDRVREIFEGS